MVYEFSGWKFDVGARTLTDPDGSEVHIVESEHDLLLKMCQNPQQLLTRETLTRSVGSADRSVDVYVSRLRKKINPRFVRALRHGGYYFTPSVKEVTYFNELPAAQG
jgi:two-component system OmpR family response regulator